MQQNAQQTISYNIKNISSQQWEFIQPLACKLLLQISIEKSPIEEKEKFQNKL